jgi:hypothetical protein
MSVSSVAQLLLTQSQDFSTIIIGDEPNTVVLSCDADNELLIGQETAATRQFVDDNYINSNDYYTIPEFQNFLTTNYTTTDDLEANYVQLPVLDDYYTKTQINNIFANYTTTDDLEANYVQNTTLDNYYTATEANNTFQPIGNYVATSSLGKFEGQININVNLAQNESFSTTVTINNFVGTVNTSCISGISSVNPVTGTSLVVSSAFASSDGINSDFTVIFTNVSSLVFDAAIVGLSLIAMN